MTLWGIGAMPSNEIKWPQERILSAIRAFVVEQHRIPEYPDFQWARHGLPALSTVRSRGLTWQRAILYAGYQPLPRKPRHKPSPQKSQTIVRR